MVDTLGSLSDDWLMELAAELDPTQEQSILWKPTPDSPQSMAYNSLAFETFFGGAAGGGKFLANNELIATPFGWKTHGEIKVGDQVCNPDGSIARVIGVFPHPNRDVYRVIFSDGASVVAGDEHLWSYWLSSTRLKADRKYPTLCAGGVVEWRDHPSGNTVDAKVCTTLQLKAMVDRANEKRDNGERPYVPIIPLTEPVTYTRASKTRQGETIRIDPYLLGVLIGDGTISGTYVQVTSVDEFIVNRMREIWGQITWDGDKTIRFLQPAPLVKQLKSYGLMGTHSHTKFIPENYLYADVRTRFALMQGLIDTDGYVDDRGHVSYTTTSAQLAKDVQQLARSLGAKASITEKEAGYKDKNGTYVECRNAYTIWMQGQHVGQFMSLPRKKERYKPFNGGITAGRRVESVEYVGKADCTCIAVDHWNQLYITTDYIVTHNTDLLIGLATTGQHKKSIIFRRDYGQLKDVVDRVKSIMGTYDRYQFNGQTNIFRNLPGGRTLELGSIPHEDSKNKYKGRAHDLKCFDEVSDFTESMYTFLIGWTRSTDPTVRVRVVAAGNPPTSADGEWVIRRWSAWIDPQHSNPALPGELRWYVLLDDQDVEVEDDKPVVFKGETYLPRSRTFIPAKLSDNPYLRDTDYRTVLMNTPEPLRSQLLYGDFGMMIKDDPWQLCPTQWVRQSRNLWTQLKDSGEVQRNDNADVSYGVDVAAGGGDMSALVKVTSNIVQWVKYSAIADPVQLGRWVLQEMDAPSRRAAIGIDAIGVGQGLYAALKMMDATVIPIKVSQATNMKDRSGMLTFLNLRAALWWLIRDAIDPNGQIKLALCPDEKLIRELTAPRFSRTHTGKIQIEANDSLRQKLGRSPDAASALMMALYVNRRHRPPLRMV